MKLRAFLETNKIFFETIAASLLSVMAVIVAIVQTNQLELQTRIAEVQVLPQFGMLVFTGDDGDGWWVVSNEGAPIRDLEFSASCFLVVKTATASMAEQKVVKLPVHDCIGGWGASWGGKGELARVNTLRKMSELRSLDTQVMERASSRNWKDTSSYFQLIVRLRYRDLLGRPHDDFVETSGFASGRAMSPAEGAAHFRTWEVIPSRFIFSDLTADKVLSLVAQASTGDILRAN